MWKGDELLILDRSGVLFASFQGMTLEVTFGCGTKQDGGTSNSSSGLSYHCTKMPNAPNRPCRALSRCAARPRAGL
ncbi:MAG: hypothetical protein V8S87_09795 [Oscillospiraceae bacterium]